MPTQTGAAEISKKARWFGWILSTVPALMMIMSAVMKFARPPDAVEGFVHLGVPIELSLALGIIELSCVIVYLIPRLAILGAILLTGYLGGAMVIHLRIGEPFIIQFLLGVSFWGGLYFREPRLRTLIPIRRPA